MKYNFLTVSQLQSACQAHKYLILQYPNGSFAVNAKIAPLALKAKPHPDNYVTDVTGFKPCTFHEYISQKACFQK